MAKFLFISFFLLNFALWIGWFGHHPIRGKSVAPSIISMTDVIKSTDKMGKKRTLTDIKDAFKKLWGDRYNYDLITEENYIDTHHKVPIVCKEHGIFYQEPKVHLQGHGCPACAKCQKLTVEEFVRRAQDVHGKIYDYSLVDKVSSNQKIKIICREHGIFEQLPHSHLYGHGCPHCSDRANLTTEEFIKRAKAVHDEMFDYSEVVYKNAKTPIQIICRKCGAKFNQTPNAHLCGKGCPICNIKNRNQSFSLPIDEWIARAKASHTTEYDYSDVHYNNLFEKVHIKCPEHGFFWQEAKSHMEGQDCPHCKNVSKGESMVSLVLDEMGIVYERQFKILNHNKACKNSNLFVDFYIPSQNIIIEYNGRQHYEPVDKFGGEDVFEEQKIRDSVLRQHCQHNSIKLIEIPYTKYREIRTILGKVLKT